MSRLCLFLLAILAFPYPFYAAKYLVGSDQIFKKPSQIMSMVEDGDTIDVMAGTYTEDVGVWTKNNLLIRGIGGFAHMKSEGMHAQGKAIWVIQGDNNIIEWIEFSGCSVPDMNGAGIRLEGTNLTLRHCYFHNNENGILAGNNPDSEILIEFCEFAHNGYGDGYSHNIYINRVKKLTFRFNDSHHCKIGHTLKSRALSNEILYNRFADEADGNASYLLDLPNGGFSVVMGNVFMQGAKASNRSLISYGFEGLSNPSSDVYIVNNTMVSERSVATFIWLNEGANAFVANNIFAGNGTAIDGNVWDTFNIHFPVIADALFEAHAAYNYSLTEKSSAVDSGLNLSYFAVYYLVPIYEYKHKADSISRTISGERIDIGAFEFQHTQNMPTLTEKERILRHHYRNGNHYFKWRSFSDNEEVTVLINNIKGQLFKTITVYSGELEVSGLPQGMWIISLIPADGSQPQSMRFIGY